jgi:hypothetical protein
MSKMLSRTFNGLDYGTREAARADARRSGKSLDEWLKDAIFEKAEGVLPEDEDLDQDEFEDENSLEVASRRLAQARDHNRYARGREPQRWRQEAPRPNITRLLDDSGAVPSRRSSFQDSRERPRYFREKPDPNGEVTIENRATLTANQRQTMKALENIANMIEDKLCRFDPRAIVEAVEALEQRVRETERKTLEALNNIAELIETCQGVDSKMSDGSGGVWGRFGRNKSKAA